jgi:hypothetical protein
MSEKPTRVVTHSTGELNPRPKAFLFLALGAAGIFLSTFVPIAMGRSAGIYPRPDGPFEEVFEDVVLVIGVVGGLVLGFISGFVAYRISAKPVAAMVAALVIPAVCGGVLTLAYDRHNHLIYRCEPGARLALWDIGARTVRWTTTSQNERIVGVSLDGDRLAVANDTIYTVRGARLSPTYIRIREVATGRELRTISLEPFDRLEHVSAHLAHGVTTTVVTPSRCKLWDLRADVVGKPIDLGDDWCSPRGVDDLGSVLLMTGSRGVSGRGVDRHDWALRNWNADGGFQPPLSLLSLFVDVFGALVPVPDGKHVVAASRGELRLVDRVTAKAVLTLKRPEGDSLPIGFFRAAFSTDGRVVALASGEVIDAWDLKTGSFLRRVRSHGGALGLSATGDRMLTWNETNELRLIELETGRLIGTFPFGELGDPSGLNRRWDVSVAFLPDGSAFLASWRCAPTL